MSSNIHLLESNSRSRTVKSVSADFRSPRYDCSEKDGALTLSVYVPGVDSSTIEIAARGPDLLVTARKEHFVRVNFGPLHIESAQKDYHLRLRLGNHLDYEALNAEIADGILTITVPKRGSSYSFNRLRKVA